jgi:hypothetical protein
LLCEFSAAQFVLAGQHDSALITSINAAIKFIAVDGRSLKSPQRQITVPPGRHHLVLRVNLPALGWKFPEVPSGVADAPYDDTFEARHHYTADGKLTRTGEFSLLVVDEDKRPPGATPKW